MRIEMIASHSFESRRRVAGEFEAGYRVTLDDGTTGLAFYSHEWDKRDVTWEQLIAEPSVTPALREFLGDSSPMSFPEFRIVRETKSGPLDQAALASTEWVAGDK